LTHVIGGNIKALFHGSTTLSLPETDNAREALPDAVARGEFVVRLVSRQKPFVVTVVARRSTPTYRPPPFS
jgi:hypothetical protein